MNNDLISREALKKKLYDFLSENSTTCDWDDIFDVIDNAPTVPLPNEQIAWEQGYEAGLAQDKQERPQGECKTCRHRDPKDKKCDYGALERAGCPFPVSDDYFCKFYEKGGAE